MERSSTYQMVGGSLLMLCHRCVSLGLNGYFSWLVVGVLSRQQCKEVKNTVTSSVNPHSLDCAPPFWSLKFGITTITIMFFWSQTRPYLEESEELWTVSIATPVSWLTVAVVTTSQSQGNPRSKSCPALLSVLLQIRLQFEKKNEHHPLLKKSII